MGIQELTLHPEMMNRETLYELRRITAEYPYYQTARLLLLKNLYLLHDPSFDDELRRASIYLTDRRVLFDLVEAAHYRLKKKSPKSFSNAPAKNPHTEENGEGESRTVSLIDTFLSSIPEEEDLKKSEEKKKEHRQPTAVDATTDYVAYLLATDFEELDNAAENDTENANGNNGNDNADSQEQPQMKGSDLIDNFLNDGGGKMTLKEEVEYTPDDIIEDSANSVGDDDYLTETLAGIYIKQKRYEKALDIMERINSSAKKKNKYFEDQKRFLKLLIENQKQTKKKQ